MRMVPPSDVYYEPLVYVVPAEEDGWVLKSILQKRLAISRKLLSRLKLTEQGIKVNGTREYISIRVHQGDVIEVRMEQEWSDDILPQALPLNIIYEDEHLLIVNKEAGRIVHPTHGHYTNTLANAVVNYWQERGERFRFRPIHRLDQETSGVLAIAKNPYVHQFVSEQMKANTVMKQYIAFAWGHLAENHGWMDGPIDRDPLEPHLRIVTPSGYSALTEYRVVSRGSLGIHPAMEVHLRLHTGRTHQIRVHMSEVGCPLVGDALYGTMPMEQTDERIHIKRHALHAHLLRFLHPITREMMEFTAELPEDMKQLRTLLNNENEVFKGENLSI